MKDGVAILKILSVQNFVLLNNVQNGHSNGSEYVGMSSKTTPYRSSLEVFPFVEQLAPGACSSYQAHE